MKGNTSRSRSFDPIQTLDDALDSVASIYVADYEIISGSIDKHVRTYDIRVGQLRVDAIGRTLFPPSHHLSVSHPLV